jgi:hypothetical protein
MPQPYRSHIRTRACLISGWPQTGGAFASIVLIMLSSKRQIVITQEIPDALRSAAGTDATVRPLLTIRQLKGPCVLPSCSAKRNEAS